MTCPTENEDMEILENEYVPVKEVQYPILIARNAGASLSAPEKADIARKRKLSVNKGKYKQRESKATASTTAWDRLKKFPNHHFAAIDRKLRCDGCSEELSMKKSSIKKHIESRKHKNGLSDIRKNKSRNQTIVACFQRRNKRENTPWVNFARGYAIIPLWGSRIFYEWWNTISENRFPSTGTRDAWPSVKQ